MLDPITLTLIGTIATNVSALCFELADAERAKLEGRKK
jgi:hypothetical protein